jgi:hypothetical protein
MDFQGYVDQVIAFVRDNESWALPIVFALAFEESLAFISLLIPATVALVGIGALIGPVASPLCRSGLRPRSVPRPRMVPMLWNPSI